MDRRKEPPVTISWINPPGLPTNPAFSQAVRVPAGADLVFVGGQNGFDATGSLAGPGLAEQTAAALDNLALCLDAAGARLDNVVAWTVLLTEGSSPREGFAAFGKAWPSTTPPPAIAVAVVSALAVPGALVEISAVAAVVS
jgi:enamine deaminase RidA (YjgF/YER057c/UK114 family)